ncbi:MAG TPA: hypothetical protein VFH78_02050 [Candidatus Thermoplasmatota archaeon]|nr:hypothetical protein [Candidatus Thermoplasmatota archaeon]
MGAATFPQIVKLLRERRADDFHYGFVLLNLAGLVLLSARSMELREWAFLGINVLGALFWLFVLALKALDLPHRAPARVPASQTAAAPARRDVIELYTRQAESAGTPAPLTSR